MTRTRIIPGSLARLLAAMAIAMTMTSAAAAAEQHLEVLFLSDAAGPIAYVEVTERAEGQRLARSAAYIFFAGGNSTTKTLKDSIRASARAPSLVDLPAAPAGLGLSSDDDGTLVFTLDDLGDWQTALPGDVAQKSSVGGPAVPASGSARLLVEPPPFGTGPAERFTAAAILYGTRGAIRGHAVVEMSADARRESTLVWPGNERLQTATFGVHEMAGARTFVADRADACERAVPTALLLWPDEGAPTRLVASAPPACLPSGRAIVPLVGVRLERRSEVPIRAVLVDEPLASAGGDGRNAATRHERLTSR